MYRITCIGYDLCEHKPFAGRLIKQNFDTQKEALAEIKKATAADVAELLEKSDALGAQVSIIVETTTSSAFPAAVMFTCDEEYPPVPYTEYMINPVKQEKLAMYDAWDYRGYRIVSSEPNKFVVFLDEQNISECEPWSLNAALDYIDEMLAEQFAMGG